jgi:transaldolase
MRNNPLRQLEALGQSVWLDYIKRDLISTGELKKLIDEDGLSGITSNPSIFEEAIVKSNEYEKDIKAMKQEKKDADTIYNALTIRDVQSAADEFLFLYQKTGGKAGYVSLEVNPHLAHDTKGTLADARRLWHALQRPNVLIKIPGTLEGLPAITQLISEGINVNVTLLFGVPRYREVAEAYLKGIEARINKNQSVKEITSVASFFLSRIDTLVDPILEKSFHLEGETAEIAKKMQGQVAIASAKMAYEFYQEIFTSDRFKSLAKKGAKTQQLLWASTSTKNPAYSDIKYVESLIGPETINTIPLETLNHYRDHGNPQKLLVQEVDKARWVFDHLSTVGINIDKLTQQLEDEGVDKFNKAFDQLINTLKRQSF